MTVRELLNVTAISEYVRIATRYGRCYVLYDTAHNLANSQKDIIDREVQSIMSVSEREETSDCIKLQAGILIIVNGSENGIY